MLVTMRTEKKAAGAEFPGMGRREAGTVPALSTHLGELAG